MPPLLTDEVSRHDPVGLLPPQAWMAWPETIAVIAALTADGAEVRFVGGCVRDSLLGRPVHDIDIATPDVPERVIALLERAGLRALPTGLAHGTITALAGAGADGCVSSGPRRFEITTLRRDVETFGRAARVAYTDDWQADAARRDFTINALSCRVDRAIVDPCEGLPDLAAGRIRFVGNAKARIEEDVLRLLRYFRFYAHYGRPPADVDALAACRALASRLGTLSGERVCAELLRILAAPDPATVLLMMQGARVLNEVLPEATWIGRLRMLSFLESRGLLRPDVAPDALRRLAVLIDVDADRLAEVSRRLKLSGAATTRLEALTLADSVPTAGMTDGAARRLLHRVGASVFRDLTLMQWAAARDRTGHSSTAESAQWSHLLDLAAHWEPRPLPVRGDDIVARGIPPGPRVGTLLARLERWWEERDFHPGRAEALAHLDALLAGDQMLD